jgi:hypothetical protein
MESEKRYSKLLEFSSSLSAQASEALSKQDQLLSAQSEFQNLQDLVFVSQNQVVDGLHTVHHQQILLQQTTEESISKQAHIFAIQANITEEQQKAQQQIKEIERKALQANYYLATLLVSITKRKLEELTGISKENQTQAFQKASNSIHLLSNRTESTSSQMLQLMETVDKVFRFQQLLAGEVFDLNSFFFYSIAIFVCFLLTATVYTAAARLPLFVGLFGLFLFERISIQQDWSFYFNVSFFRYQVSSAHPF